MKVTFVSRLYWNLEVTSNMAALEVGGPWFSSWKGQNAAPELLKRAVQASVDVEGIYSVLLQY